MFPEIIYDFFNCFNHSTKYKITMLNNYILSINIYIYILFFLGEKSTIPAELLPPNP